MNAVLDLPAVFSREATEILGATYIARADKARAELGWKPRPLQSGMKETFEWIEETTPPPPLDERERKAAAMALLAAAGVFILWLLSRDRE